MLATIFFFATEAVVHDGFLEPTRLSLSKRVEPFRLSECAMAAVTATPRLEPTRRLHAGRDAPPIAHHRTIYELPGYNERMLSNPISGVLYFLSGLKLITRSGVRRYVLIPLLINVILFGGLVILGINQFEALLDWLMPEIPQWLQWLAWLLWVFFALATLLIVFYTFTLVANLVSAPFNGYLALAVERHLTGHAPVTAMSAGASGVLAETGATLRQEAGKLFYLATRSLPVLLLFFVPVLNVAAPLIWIVLSAWMLALEYMDFPMGNHGVRFVDTRQRLAEKRMLSLGFGGAAMVGTLIPFFNLLVIPVAVAGATAMWVKEFADTSATTAQARQPSS